MPRVVKHLQIGWNTPEFEKEIQECINDHEQRNLSLLDIKIDSRGNDTLLIFE